MRGEVQAARSITDTNAKAIRRGGLTGRKGMRVPRSLEAIESCRWCRSGFTPISHRVLSVMPSSYLGTEEEGRKSDSLD